MTIISIIACLLILVVLIARFHINPFVAFLIASVAGALMLGMPPEKIPGSLERGVGDLLGQLSAILCLSAMFGKLIADSGAAQRISTSLIKLFGEKYIIWALMFSGFFIGIPLFYNVGFVLMVPLVFSVAYQTRMPVVYLGVPLLAPLSVAHGFLPPHPSPTAIIPLFGASMGVTLMYGIVVAIPTMIIAGPLFAQTVRKIKSEPLATFKSAILPEEQLPNTWVSFIITLLPVTMIAIAAFIPYALPKDSAWQPWIALWGDPMMVMLLGLLIAVIFLGVARGTPLKIVMSSFSSAIKDIAPILLIIAGAGALKQVLSDSGVSDQIAKGLTSVPLNPLLIGWFIALAIRVALGSATAAGLTAAGIVAPMVLHNHNINPNLMVLAIGAGSMMCSHVNDSGFWMFKEYFNLSIKDTFRSWTLMETIVGVAGIIGVLLLNMVV
ncbi:MAG TPA: gluconate:H+ symporter [Steroidobacteraceae bacterium]|nr:gluconate:H+ symporter [Steroidobacteraceae bacterium]